MYQPVGDLHIRFPGTSSLRAIIASWTLKKRVATTSYTVGGVKYTRQVIASVPDQIIAIRLTADKPGKLTFQSLPSSPQKEKGKTEKEEGWIFAGVSGDREGIQRTGRVSYTCTRGTRGWAFE